jgi:predicted nuclease of restriction endonuclease-like (RecB) superfamily
MEEELMKFVLELVVDHDIVCTELHEDINEEEFCSKNCEGVNEACVRRLMYKRIFENK